MLKIKQANWENWSGDIYPIFHGQYYSNINGYSLIEEYKYCHIENIAIKGIDIYSNGDILLTYVSQISNNPLNNSDIPQSVNSLVRIDSRTGKTIWAKELINHFNLYFFDMVKTTIIEDVIWCLHIYTFNYFNAPGVITRIDGNGSIIEIFYTPFNAKTDSSQTYIFLTSDFYVFSDSSFIVMAIWTYLKDEFGVSLYSASDFCYFKIDSNRNFQWSTSIDFLNNFEERQSIYEYNGIVYVAIVTSKYYFCLQTLDKNTGVVNNSQCAYVSKEPISYDYRLITINYVSDKYVYAYGNSYFPNYYGGFSLYVFSTITLKLIKVFSFYSCERFHVFRDDELETDVIYWIEYSKIHQFYFDITAYGLTHYQFDSDFMMNLYTTLFMKQISNGNYYMAINQRNVYYRNRTTFVSIILRVDSHLNTNSWLTFQPAVDEFKVVSQNIGEDANSNELVYYTNITAKSNTIYSSSLYNKSSIVTDYYYVDATQWIWPRSFPNLNNCNISLPSFNMINFYDVHIGK